MITVAIFVGIAVFILFAGMLLPNTSEMKQEQHEKTIGGYGNFPPLNPASNAPDAIRTHRRENQRYLMDMWEQRLEEETGAKQLRSELAVIAIETDRAYKALQDARFHARRLGMTHTEYYDVTDDGRVIKKTVRDEGVLSIESHYNMLSVKQNKIAADYNARMGRPRGTAFPTYKYSA